MTTESTASGTFIVAVEGGGLKMDKEVDQATVLAVVNLLMSGEVAPPTPPTVDGTEAAGSTGAVSAKPRRHRRPSPSKNGKTKRASKTKSVGLDKDLSLRPKNKKSFADFANEKTPSNHQDKVTVCVFWLIKTAGHKATPEAVNSCYEGAGWKRPADLRNKLAVTASKCGWLDTGDYEDIKITTSGEDHVKHDLPDTVKK
ncbi:MAG: hypothetical protein JSS68_20095 [Actinobacteria bacterium]|nr:hypothetical protein [Actinomycetota bacterium]